MRRLFLATTNSQFLMHDKYYEYQSNGDTVPAKIDHIVGHIESLV